MQYSGAGHVKGGDCDTVSKGDDHPGLGTSRFGPTRVNPRKQPRGGVCRPRRRLAWNAVSGTRFTHQQPAPSASPLPSPVALDTATTLPSTVTPAQEDAVRLPHDEGAHLSGLEWWFCNGHLSTETGQEFSYHFVTFQSVLPSGLTPQLAQLSWADHAVGLHLTQEQADAPHLEPSSGELDLPTAGWRMSGNGETYQLSFGTGDYAVELEAVSQRLAVQEHDPSSIRGESSVQLPPNARTESSAQQG